VTKSRHTYQHDQLRASKNSEGFKFQACISNFSIKELGTAAGKTRIDSSAFARARHSDSQSESGRAAR
jgi:hypothetical protein